MDLLGAARVVVDGVERPVTARRPRAVLACLAMQASKAVSADRLLEEVWGDDLPETGVRAVAYQIARLRSLLEPDRVGEGTLIATTPAGYVLCVDPDAVDAHRFEHLVDQARDTLASDPAHGEQLLVEALGLWRGQPFADLDDEPFVADETHRLDQLHLTARRTLADARIQLGRHSEVIAELEALVADHPLDEALVGLLMNALHHTGRTADALRTYDQLRRRLATELGIEPSHHLQHLERQLLGSDVEPSSANGPRPRPIPLAASSFVGRTDELDVLQDWLATARLVTLCGFGGLGKTRLAQQLARTIADRFTDGVWYVDLAPVTDPSAIVDTIIAAGGVTIPPTVDRHERLLTHLTTSELLVVLDNCEHLADDLACITTRILHHAPHVRVLATSRIPLDVPGEAIFTLHPLDRPSANELFADRARLARPGCTIDTTNRDPIERLAALLDGIPLAIELAAARLTVMSPDQIADHLERRLDLLANGRPHPDPRQRSLTAVLDWTYHLLDPTDRELLRRLTVCVGGFDLDAAHAIGTPDPTTSTVTDTLDHLTHLTHTALVEFDPRHHNAPRYRILEPVRQHLATKLTPTERDANGFAHATHYATAATRIAALADTDPHAAYELGNRELPNLRAAIDWAYRNGHPRLGLTVLAKSRLYFMLALLHGELLRRIRTGLDLVDRDDDTTLEALSTAVVMATNQGEHELATRLADRVKQGLDIVEAPRIRADLLSCLSSPTYETDPQVSYRYNRAAIELGAAPPWRNLAYLGNRIDGSWLKGRIDDSEEILRRLDEIVATTPRPSAMQYKIRAGIAASDGRWDDVLRVAGEADAEPHLEPIYRAALAALTVEALGALGRHEEAVAVLARLDPAGAQLIHRERGRLLAAIELRRGQPRVALEHLAVVVEDITRDGRRLALGMHVASLLGVAACDLGRHETAAVLLGHAAAEQRRLGIVPRASDRPLVDGAIERCRSALGADRYDELAAQGAAIEWRDLPSVEPDTPGSRG